MRCFIKEENGDVTIIADVEKQFNDMMNYFESGNIISMENIGVTRLNDNILRLLAADMATLVLPIWKHHLVYKDTDLQLAIDMARNFAHGKCNIREINSIYSELHILGTRKEEDNSKQLSSPFSCCVFAVAACVRPSTVSMIVDCSTNVLISASHSGLALSMQIKQQLRTRVYEAITKNKTYPEILLQ